MLETPSTQIQHPEQPNHTTQTQGTEPVTPITCIICHASYTPSNLYQRFLQVSPIVLESAYMSICHYCFRCRRPACPECWDPIHHICGACVQDANLPFRTQVEPLDGILLPLLSPISESTQENTTTSQFICVKHGKFHNLATPSTTITSPEPPLIPQQQDPTPPQVQPDPYLESPPTLEDASPIETKPSKPHRSTIKKVEIALAAILLLALLAIAVLIVLAEYSVKVNTFIDHLLHIDIRAEIAYLLDRIQQHL